MKLIMNSNLFEYDIRGLLMAYFPWEKFDTEEGSFGGNALKVLYRFAEEPRPEGEHEGRAFAVSPEETASESGREETAPESGLKEPENTGKERYDLVTGVEFLLENEGRVLRNFVDFTGLERSIAKTAAKKGLYALLKEDRGAGLPWGTLTGIRPTKIPMAMLYEGKTDEEICRHMEEDLLCSPGKTALSLEIAKREKALIDTADRENGYSLYVGIPFCPTTCLYCSFTSFPIGRYQGKVAEYLTAVEKELLFTAETFRGKTLDSVYFGGGTPTALSADELKRLFGFVAEHFDLSHTKEWTVEAGRPDSITEEKLRVMREFPVTRISINPQTMQQKTLDLIGRFHTVDEFREKFALARSLGFDNINTDLILGLPGETAADMEDTLDQIAALRPESVTIHSLAIKRASRLNQHKAFYEAYRMENTDGMMAMAREKLLKIGLHPYYLYRQKNMAGNLENVGYTLPGKEGIYNILIMEEVETIVACGAGTVTKRVDPSGLIERCDNVKDVDLYLQKIDEMIDRKRRLLIRAPH